MKATAQANANIALIKYWGKRDPGLNLPAVGSISITLEEMRTVSQVQFSADLKRDLLILNGLAADKKATRRVSGFLDLVRAEANLSHHARIVSHNNFPTGAGLASSASAFASLTLAATRAADLDLSPVQLSEMARRGSGSAARSIFGGFVEMKVGTKTDGSDAVALQIADRRHWDLQVLVAITSEDQKETGSTDAMIHTAQTSPFYHSWIQNSTRDLENMRQAISQKNFTRLGELTEYSCLKLHALVMSAFPGLLYWNRATTECIHVIRGLRKQGTEAYFTIDAGPQVKAICLKKDIPRTISVLETVPGVLRVITTGLGPNAKLVENID